MTDDERDKKLALREARNRREMIRVYGDCVRTLRRIFLPEGHKDRHPDADRTWSESSMQTRVAMHLAKTQADNPTADHAGLFGIIIVQARSKDAGEWEKKAKEIDEAQKQKAIEAIATVKEPGK